MDPLLYSTSTIFANGGGKGSVIFDLRLLLRDLRFIPALVGGSGGLTRRHVRSLLLSPLCQRGS